MIYFHNMTKGLYNLSLRECAKTMGAADLIMTTGKCSYKIKHMTAMQQVKLTNMYLKFNHNV